jgi:hypothetical protein
MTSFLTLILIFLHVWLASSSSQCYMLNGDLATADFQPCTSSLASGSNSACCNLGKNPPDICLGGGLCQRMDSTEGNFMIYAVGCTDKSGKDPACPQYCPSSSLISLIPSVSRLLTRIRPRRRILPKPMLRGLQTKLVLQRPDGNDVLWYQRRILLFQSYDSRSLRQSTIWLNSNGIILHFHLQQYSGNRNMHRGKLSCG